MVVIRKLRVSWIVASIALWGALFPSPAFAQTCFRGRPTPERHWFWITESGVRWPLAHPSASDSRHEFLWSLGVMKNVGRRSAAGLALQFSTDYAEEGTYRLSLKPRYQFWLSPFALRFGSLAGVVFGLVTPLVLLARAAGGGSY
jgi:hypothetical protein